MLHEEVSHEDIARWARELITEYENTLQYQFTMPEKRLNQFPALLTVMSSALPMLATDDMAKFLRDLVYIAYGAGIHDAGVLTA